MNNNIIVLDGNIDNLTQDCTYAKIREGNKDTIALKQYTAGNQKTSTIYLTKEEILKLVNELTEPNGLPRKFKFKSTVKGMDQIIYRAIRAENSYVVIWTFMGEEKDMIMSIENMIYHFNQKEYEFVY